ncbi:uncharacterized protein LOC124124532 [Haliotis rufescens]|uniref:uncharacterized protein LOC124124532 n=1 Tax=Haliotis rufescens TaxID=6454 RepID=UPI00201F3200|nr:uncharacterized protein LOC124124532 [Haliotis rufescens]
MYHNGRESRFPRTLTPICRSGAQSYNRVQETQCADILDSYFRTQIHPSRSTQTWQSSRTSTETSTELFGVGVETAPRTVLSIPYLSSDTTVHIAGVRRVSMRGWNLDLNSSSRLNQGRRGQDLRGGLLEDHNLVCRENRTGCLQLKPNLVPPGEIRRQLFHENIRIHREQ